MVSTLAGHEVNGRFDAIAGVGMDRRRCRRVKLHWAVLLAGPGLRQPIRSETADIGSRGFYCVIEEPMKPGELLECDLVVPTHARQDEREDSVLLRCAIEVVRVEKCDLGFGVACAIREYTIVRLDGGASATVEDPFMRL
jgi:hypothetical protein